MKIHFLVIALALSAFTACQSKRDSAIQQSCPAGKPVMSNKKLLNFAFKERYDLPLDDSLVVASDSQIQADTSSGQLIILDKYFQRLVFYDLRKQIMLRRINLVSQNFKDGKISAFKQISQDSLILFSSNNNTFFIADLDGKVRIERPLVKPKSDDRFMAYPSPFIRNAAPIFWRSGEIITTGFLFGEHDQINPKTRFCRVSTQVSEEQSKFDISYPAIYDSANWGGDFYRSVYSAMDDAGNMYISFPAEHRLLKISEKNKKSWVEGASPLIACIPALPDSKDSLRTRNYHFKINEHYSTNYSYKNILYLAPQKLFVRVMEMPLKKSELNADRSGYKPAMLLLYDASHQYIDRIKLPDELSTDNVFITREGICFLNRKNKNENKAQYTLLRITLN